MPASVVNSAGGNYTTNTGSHSVDWSGFFTPTAGNALLLTLHSGPNTDAPVSAPSGWTEVQKGADGAPFGCVVYRKENVSSGDTSATITGWSLGGQNGRWSVVEFGGVPATGAFGPSAKAVESSGSTTITAGPTASLSQATGLAVGIFVVDNGSNLNGAWSAGTWTTITDQPRSTSGGHTVASRDLSSTSGISATYSGFTSDQSWLAIVALYDTGGGGGSPYTLTATQGSYSLSGQSVGLKAARRLLATQGAYALNGQSVGLSKSSSYALQPTQGSYSLNGQAVNLRAARRLAATQGAYALNGQSVGLSKSSSYAVQATQGSYSLNGQSVGLLAARRLVATQGAYALNGQSVTLTKVSGYQLLATAGAYALNGQAVNLRATRRLLATQGAYALAGQSVTLTKSSLSYSLSVTPGSYALTGQDVALRRALRLAASTGYYTLTGRQVGLHYSGIVVFDRAPHPLTLHAVPTPHRVTLGKPARGIGNTFG